MIGCNRRVSETHSAIAELTRVTWTPSVHDPIDPGIPIPQEDRQAAMRSAHRRCIDPKRLTAIDVAVLVLPAFGAILVMFAANRVLARLGFDPSGIPLAIGSGLLYGAAFWLVYRRKYTRLVYSELRDRGYDLCPACGYWRAGIGRAVACPECGAAAAPLSTERG
ncbi:MAG: hypothetical protein D6692_08865 [Planctomycetota bacterium]|nr:MAG: hypothetical protein D6692_08865 [Planctomycetota bacterium]